MKTTACLLVIIALDGSFRAPSASAYPTDVSKQVDATTGSILPFDRATGQLTRKASTDELPWRKLFPSFDESGVQPQLDFERKAPQPKTKPPVEEFSPFSDPWMPEVPSATPPEVWSLARKARKQFDRGNFRAAERIYDEALAIAPDNLYLLSNKGVVLLRQQKCKLAAEIFKRAISIAPRDDFSHCALGIAEYQLGKFDEAINALTKALAINPKNATTHNYLGIAASQKGWHEAARKELETATAIDPSYADAHFNLAIVLSTQTPPNKEAARQHYQRAIELGVEPDSTLEQMIQ